MRTKLLNMVKESSLDRQCSRVLSSIAKILENEGNLAQKNIDPIGSARMINLETQIRYLKELTPVKIQDFVSEVVGNRRKIGEEIITEPGGEEKETKEKVDLKSGPDEDEAERDDGGSGFTDSDESKNTVGPIEGNGKVVVDVVEGISRIDEETPLECKGEDDEAAVDEDDEDEDDDSNSREEDTEVEDVPLDENPVEIIIEDGGKENNYVDTIASHHIPCVDYNVDILTPAWMGCERTKQVGEIRDIAAYARKVLDHRPQRTTRAQIQGNRTWANMVGN
ncbi:hypothetical protein U1Q18_040211, partial [Sarracenia purpurea var. burkii]